nr:MAG TPA_asm: hypothetical protein [Bacteriophage sp.]
MLTVGLTFGVIASVNTTRQQPDSEDAGSRGEVDSLISHTKNRQ